MNKKVIIGIDVGGSTTKIVGFDISSATPVLIEPIFVRATDPVTSVYGAFGKFTDKNDLSLENISKVMITGVGSTHITKPIYSLPCEIVPEFRSIGLGGLYLSGLDKAIVVSLGTGTALIHAVRGEEPVHLGGTGVGGGTLIGLSKLMLQMDTVEHIERLAAEGNLERVDLKLNTISKTKKYSPNLSDSMTVSNFGNISDIAEKSDIALGIINMVCETIGMVSMFAAKNYGLKDIILTGNLTTMAHSKTIFASINSLFDLNFIIPEYAQFGTVIGAALSGCPNSDEKI